MTSQTNTASKRDLLAIVATALVTFAGVLSETSMNVTFSHLSQVFGLGLGTLQWITTGYLLAVAVTITLGATLAHNWTERQILFTALAIFTLGNGVAMLAPNFAFLMVGRVLQGAATGIAMPLMFNLVIDRMPRHKLGFYMGLTELVASLAPALGPTYGGAMIARFDWHMIFAFIMPVPIISFLIAYFFLDNGPRKPRRAFDIWSFASLTLVLVSSLITVASLEEGEGVNVVYLVIFLVSLVFFIWRSLTVKSTLLDIRLFAKPVLLFAILPFMIYQFTNLAANFLIPNLLEDRGVSTTLSGFSLLPGTLSGALLAPFFGRLYDNRGPKLTLYGGNLLAFLAMLVFALTSDWLNLAIVLIFYIVFTLGRNTAFGNSQTYSTAHIAPEHTADVTALFQLGQTFAGALGTAIAAVMVNQAGDINAGSQNVFILLSLLLAINFGFYFLLFKDAEKREQ